MKAGKVGKALEKAIAAEPSELKALKTKVQMMNPIRREVFQYLCRYPCSAISKISRDLKRSIHTVEWHLKRLIEDKYIMARKDSNNYVYYPIGCLEPEDLPILAALNIHRVRDMFLYILENPGSTQREVGADLGVSHQSVGRITKRLDNLKLISTVDDGKYKRYYPSDLLPSKRQENYERMKAFKQRILEKLQSEGLNPAVLRSSDTDIMVRITLGRAKASLALSCNPFATVLS